MTEIEAFLNNYYNCYETMAKETDEGISDGFYEGLREGIKQGFVAGIKESRISGFDKVDVKSMEEILKSALETASDEALTIMPGKTTVNEYRKKINHSFKQKMEEACSKAVEEIKNADFELKEASASELKNRVDSSAKRIKEHIGNACSGAKKKLPTDMIFKTFLDPLQEDFNRNLDENLEACEKMICKEIDSKIENKKVDHD